MKDLQCKDQTSGGLDMQGERENVYLVFESNEVGNMGSKNPGAWTVCAEGNHLAIPTHGKNHLQANTSLAVLL